MQKQESNPLVVYLGQKEGSRPHRIKKHSMLTMWIKDSMPELLNGTATADQKLDMVMDFLENTEQMEDDVLAAIINRHLYCQLCGFKLILAEYRHNWDSAAQSLKQHKQLFQPFVQALAQNTKASKPTPLKQEVEHPQDIIF